MAGDTNLTVSAFERIMHTEDDGTVWWSARDLADILGYTVWRNFADVIEEAKEVCRTNSGDVDRLFAAVVKKSRGRDALDYRLTRHACYIIAESADGRKPQVAFAKMYFALTTERYELLAASEEERARLEERRILARENTELGLRAQAAGVLTREQFQRFWTAGHVGLYEKTIAWVKARKGLTPGQDNADWSGSLELSANHFRAALAHHLMDERKVSEPAIANATHKEAGASVREVLLAKGIQPELLPKPTKSYQQLLREEEARARIAPEDATGLWSLLPEPEATGDEDGT
jgi:DNA-damage-inducible protein D